MTPSSQKADAAPIGFLLFDSQNSNNNYHMDLIIRPEDLSRREPARVLEHQTLGGLWVDDFGQGVTTIEISGTTGWHGGQSEDGRTLFQDLHDKVFAKWFALRDGYAATGKNPDNVQLIFSDSLNQHVDVVVPKQFTLRRHKARPLLAQYQISMLSLGPAEMGGLSIPDSIWNSVNNPYGRYTSSIANLDAIVQQRMALFDSVNLYLGDLSNAANEVLATSSSLLTAVSGAAATLVGIFDSITGPLLYASIQLEQAARNAFLMLTLPYAITANAKYTLMAICGNLSDSYCTLRNGFNILTSFWDVGDMFGASNCSSTGGGRPLSPFEFQNPFLSAFASEPNPVTVSAAASASMSALASADPQAPMAVPVIKQHLANISSGVSVPG